MRRYYVHIIVSMKCVNEVISLLSPPSILLDFARVLAPWLGPVSLEKRGEISPSESIKTCQLFPNDYRYNFQNVKSLDTKNANGSLQLQSQIPAPGNLFVSWILRSARVHHRLPNTFVTIIYIYKIVLFCFLFCFVLFCFCLFVFCVCFLIMLMVSKNLPFKKIVMLIQQSSLSSNICSTVTTLCE